MSGKLYMLTPVASPMATRPASPTTHEAAGAAAASNPGGSVITSNGRCGRLAKLGSMHNSSRSAVGLSVAASDGLLATTATQAASAGSSPRAPAIDSSASTTYSQEQQQQQVRWRSPPCCSSCGAAKADGGSCSGCGNRFCKACMLPESNSSRSEGLLGGACASKAVRSGLGGSCSHCSSLCNACKPVTCSFCEPSSGLDAAARMCEACAGTCDSCKRAACDPCAASFAACASCGYAICEACRLQMHMGQESVTGPAAAARSGCWCSAPPLRSASNVRHISSQRYQLLQLHPSVLASSMQAAGLRDPEEYDEEDIDYADEFDYDFDFNPATSSSVMNAAAAFDAVLRGSGNGSDKLQRADLHQQLDADVLLAHHKHWAGTGAGSDRLAGLDSQSLGAVLGAIGGSHGGAYGLASPSSSHSSGSHMPHGSYQGTFAAAAAAVAAAGAGSSSAYSYQQQQQRGGGVGTGAAAVVAAAAAGVGAHREVRCI